MFQNKNLERHLTFFASCISLLKWALWETLYSHNIVANDFIALHKVNLCHTAYSISGRSSFRHTLCNFKWRFVLFKNKKKTKTSYIPKSPTPITSSPTSCNYLELPRNIRLICYSYKEDGLLQDKTYLDQGQNLIAAHFRMRFHVLSEQLQLHQSSKLNIEWL